MANSDVVVEFGADTDALQGSLAGLADDVLNWVGGINPAVAGVVGTVAGIGVAAFNVAESFHEAYNQIIVGTGATGDQLESLKENFRNLYKQVPQDAAEVGTALAGVNTALGLQGEELENATKGFLDLSDSIAEDAGPLIQNVTQAMNAWGVSASDATLVQDKLLVVSQQTGIGVTELGSQLSKGESIFKQFGLSMDESAALLGQFHKNGLDAGTVTGGLQKALREMTESGVKPSKEAFFGLIDNIKNAGSESASTQAAVDLFGKSGIALGQAIREGKLDLDGLVESLAGAEGQVARTDDATNTIGESFTLLSHNLESLLEPLGVVLVDGLSAVLEGVLALFDPLTYTSDGFKAILDWLSPLTDAFNNNIKPALETVGTLLLGLGVTIIQGALIPAATFLWNNVLVPLGGFLRDVLAGTINTVVGALNGFLGVLQSIPGVSSLFEAGQKAVNAVLGDGKTKADDAKASTTALKDTHAELATTLNTQTRPAVVNVTGAINDKKKATELAKTAAAALKDAEKVLADGYAKLTTPAVKNVLQAQKDVDAARKTLTENTKKLFDAEQKLTAASNSGKASAKDLQSAMDALERTKKNVATATDNLKNAQTDLSAAQKKAKEDADAQAKAFEEIGKELDKITVEVVPSFNVGMLSVNDTISVLKNTVADAKITSDDTRKALESLGVTPKEKLQELADEATKNFNLIKESGTASPVEIRQAHIRELEAIKAAFVAQGTDLPPEQQKTLDALKSQQDAFAKGSTGPSGVFTEWAAGIKSLTGTLGTDMIKGLFTDPGSFGGSLMNKLNTIKDSFFDVFTNKVGSILDDFIEKGISKVMGALDGVIDKLTGSGGVGSAFSKVFDSGGTGAVNTATNAGTSGSSSGASAGAAAASGVTGMVTMVAGVATAISSIIGNFQMAKQETTLNAIEHNTRYSMMYIGERADGGILGVLFKLLEEVSWGYTAKAVEESRDWIKGPTQDWLNKIADSAYWSLKKLESIDGIMTWKVPAQLDQLIAKPISVTYNSKVYLDSKEIAAYIEDDIEFAGSLA